MGRLIGRFLISSDFLNDVNSRMKQLRKWIYQLLKGLKYMHGQNYVHRDLKPSNIFLDNFGDIAIGDFGVGRVTSDFERAFEP